MKKTNSHVKWERVNIPDELKPSVLGRQQSKLRAINAQTGATAIIKDGEVYIIAGNEEQRKLVKKKIGLRVFDARQRSQEKNSSEIRRYIDGSHLPGDCKLAYVKNNLVPTREYDPQDYDYVSSKRHSKYQSHLVEDVLSALHKVKETETHPKADMWCQFGTAVIRGPEEENLDDREWSFDQVNEKLQLTDRKTSWKMSYREGVDLDARTFRENDFTENMPYLARYEFTYLTPCHNFLRCKVWISHGDGQDIVKTPFSDEKNLLEEIHFTDETTRSRCRGWLVIKQRKCLDVDILFPGCKYNCIRFGIRGRADSDLAMVTEYVPNEQVRHALARYLSQLTLVDETGSGILQLPENIPEGFHLTHKRLCERTLFKTKSGFAIILSKEREWRNVTEREGNKEVTKLHINCEEWERLLGSGTWEPELIVRRIPDLLALVKDVHALIKINMQETGLPSTIPPEILARGPLALKSYEKALADGETCVKTVPIMLIGQDRAGKTSLKKSLKGVRFDPEEDSTVGIDVDPSHFELTTETWRTGTAGAEQDTDAAISFDHHAARWIVNNIKGGNKTPLIEPSPSEIKTSSDNDETEISRHIFTSEREGDTNSYETPIEPAAFLNEKEFNISSFPVEHNPKALSGFTRNIPEEIAFETEKLLKGNWEDNRENIYSTLWDFAGQSVYYVTHPLFLTARAIYCLVYDLSLNPNELAKPLVKQGVYKKYQDTFNLKTNLDYLDFWMRSVASVAKCARDHKNTATITSEEGLLPQKLPPVFLVCTHADTPYDKNRSPQEIAYEILGCLKSKPYGIHLLDVFVVDNRKSGTACECSEVIRLRQHVLAVAEQLPYVNEAIPIKWLKFEKVITTLKKKGNKCICFEDAKGIASKVCDVTEESDIKTLLDYWHDLRNIIHFDDSPELNKLVVLDPQWLIDVFKKVITVQPAYQLTEKKLLDKWNKLEAHGLLDEKLLVHMWTPLSNEKETYQSLIAIMEKFSLMCPWPLDASGNKSYLVPSMLKSHPPREIIELVASSEVPSLFLRFEDGHIPQGLFPRLVLEIFLWGKKEKFWKPAKLQLFCNFARYFTSTDNDCSVIFLCHSSFVEIVVHNANTGLHSDEGLFSKMSFSPNFQLDTNDVTCTRAVCSQVCLTLECMRHEFCWLKNMRYELSIICPVCCYRGGVNYCPAHGKQGCKEEECLHFWSISTLRSAKNAKFCTRSASAKNTRVPVSQFSLWFPPLSHKVLQPGIDDSYKSFTSSGGGNEDKALAFPDKLRESLASQSCDPQQIVSLFKEKQLLMEASWEQRDPQTMKWIRFLSREANLAKRSDVVQYLRSISPEGTVGPLLPEKLDVRGIPFQQGRQLTIALSGGGEWKLVAEKLGLSPDEIRYLDNRVLNPAEALLACVAEKRGLTIGDLYDVLRNCGLSLLADKL